MWGFYKVRAMTLMEILVAIALVAVLATVSINNFIGVLNKSKENLAKSFLKGHMRSTIIREWRFNESKFVNGEVIDEKSLKNQKADNSAVRIAASFAEYPKDPWGNPLKITCDSSKNTVLVEPNLDANKKNSPCISGKYKFTADGRVSLEIEEKNIKNKGP
ncbi:MAG: type II secretion system GspH family protein [Puniceicoccales bacterium]|nr:type II secretion system GspH family protein [Puniceicoccales bacterium]